MSRQMGRGIEIKKHSYRGISPYYTTMWHVKHFF
jgi:hypothetical protein